MIKSCLVLFKMLKITKILNEACALWGTSTLVSAYVQVCHGCLNGENEDSMLFIPAQPHGET